jgi:hypothetical protein
VNSKYASTGSSDNTTHIGKALVVYPQLALLYQRSHAANFAILSILRDKTGQLYCPKETSPSLEQGLDSLLLESLREHGNSISPSFAFSPVISTDTSFFRLAIARNFDISKFFVIPNSQGFF